MNLLTDIKKIEQDLKEGMAERIRKECPSIPVVKDITCEVFQKEYVQPNKPVILRGLINNWPAFKKWDIDFFAEKYGNMEVCVNLYDTSNIERKSIASFIQGLKVSSADKPTYLQEWWFSAAVPELKEDILIPGHFSNDENLRLLGFSNTTLWIGSKGAGTPFHQDSPYVNVWTAQIRGKKEWIIWDKNAVLHQGKDGKADYDEFLANPANNIMQGILEQGDILYMPYKWWHRTDTLEHAVSLNTFYITEEIVRRYIISILSIPIAVCLNRDLLLKYSLRRYNISMSRIDVLCEQLGLDKGNIMGIDTTEAVDIEKQRIIA